MPETKNKIGRPPGIVEVPRWLRKLALEQAALDHGVTVKDMILKSRKEPLPQARADAARWLRAKGYSFPAIAKVMRRDHTSIMYMCREETRQSKKERYYDGLR